MIKKKNVLRLDWCSSTDERLNLRMSLSRDWVRKGTTCHTWHYLRVRNTMISPLVGSSHHINWGVSFCANIAWTLLTLRYYLGYGFRYLPEYQLALVISTEGYGCSFHRYTSTTRALLELTRPVYTTVLDRASASLSVYVRVRRGVTHIMIVRGWPWTPCTACPYALLQVRHTTCSP